MLTFNLEKHQDVVDELNGRLKSLRHAELAVAAQPMCFGVDLSHWQGPIDFAKVKAAGFAFVVLKATEGTGYVDPNFRTYRAQAHAAGLIVLIYHFVGSSSARRVYDVAAELDHFVATVGTLAVGEGAAEDYEPANPPPNPGDWSRAWLDGVRARLGVSPWIYMNSSTERGINWTAAGIPDRYGLWLALYDNDPDMDPVVHWPALAAEQYWDRATVPGIAGPVDVDVFYGTAAQLLKYCKQAGPTPSPQPPTPAPEDDDLTPDQAAMLARIDAAVAQIGDGPVGLHALQARDASTDADNRSGFILTAVQTQIVPALNQLVAAASTGQQIAVAKLTADITAGVTANLTQQLLAQVDDVVKTELGKDNAAQAQAIVTAIAAKLGA